MCVSGGKKYVFWENFAYVLNEWSPGHLNMSHLLIYTKDIKNTKTNYARMMQKGEKIQLEMEKYFNKLNVFF